MARHTGKNGTVKVDDTDIDGLVSFDITEEIGVEDITAARDTWEDHDTTLKKWSGSITMRLDHVGDGQDLRAGDQIAFQGYTEGDATGKTYLSGTATVTSHGVNHEYKSPVERTYAITGKGALSVATVGA
ncbi:MAG: hypothetical protein VX874_15890 [Pseudomonadota bacterium]|nr:hypothetical protein [Pseudomonadota bacterium]